MNNEIHKLNSYLGTPAQASGRTNTSINAPIQNDCMADCACQMQNSMEFLGNINRATLNATDKSVISSTASFLANPDYAQHYNDMYDSLIERGYDAQNALQICDNIMLALKNQKTYKE